MRGVIQIGVRWNTVRCSTSGAMAGTYWIALGAGADRRDAFPRERLAVIPARRVKRPAAEPLGARDRRDDGNVEHAEPADEHVGRERLAGLGVQLPLLVGLSPATRRVIVGVRAHVACVRRTGRCSVRGTRGSPAASRTCGSTTGSARTSTSRGATARRTWRPDTRCRARCRRRRRSVRRSCSRTRRG